MKNVAILTRQFCDAEEEKISTGFQGQLVSVEERQKTIPKTI